MELATLPTELIGEAQNSRRRSLLRILREGEEPLPFGTLATIAAVIRACGDGGGLGGGGDSGFGGGDGVGVDGLDGGEGWDGGFGGGVGGLGGGGGGLGGGGGGLISLDLLAVCGLLPAQTVSQTVSPRTVSLIVRVNGCPYDTQVVGALLALLRRGLFPVSASPVSSDPVSAAAVSANPMFDGGTGSVDTGAADTGFVDTVAADTGAADTGVADAGTAPRLHAHTLCAAGGC
ncbi:hypothetical protein T492DRAFT_520720 [Pavlovales sp. CCMP2436]|nr:hypothetical protein T492DRAFT_520720 [Pavlovales sp. CCMP2436]